MSYSEDEEDTGADVYSFEPVPEPIEEIVPEDQDPRYSSEEWEAFVLGSFTKEELVDGQYPTINGLRRVCELLLGEIVFSGPVEIEQSMDANHCGRASVMYEIVIAWKRDIGPYVSINDGLPIRKFRGMGGSWTGNTADMFAVFPEAIAENRAEVRALRKALRLKNVAADELPGKDTAAVTKQIREKQKEKETSGDWEEASLITDQQKSVINSLCERLNIDVDKFINSGERQYQSVELITRKTAAKMIQRLNEYQGAGNIEIPQVLLKETEDEG
jgi:hypothetical protein